MPKAADKLAFAVSSSDAVSRAQYKRVFDRLYITDAVTAGFNLDDVDRYRRDVARDLEALGVCDFLYREDRVRACSPYLSALPRAGLPAVILTGARTPDLLRRLKTVAKQRRAVVLMTACDQPAFPLLPNRVEVQAATVEALREFASTADVPFLEAPAARLLLGHAASIDTYLAARRWQPRAEEPNWMREDFDPAVLHFTRAGSATTRLSSYMHPQLRHLREHFFVEGDAVASVDRDWGRFCALARAGRNALHYDASQAALFVPVTIPLPRIYARALTLCSGFAPQEVHDPMIGTCRAFLRVPTAYVALLGMKLQQRIVPVSFPHPLRGAHD
ncbi:MAG: hypothetical protein ABI779_18180 [Acidobacteriota bacterium]